jgi:hypothetical protein
MYARLRKIVLATFSTIRWKHLVKCDEGAAALNINSNPDSQGVMGSDFYFIFTMFFYSTKKIIANETFCSTVMQCI